VQKDQPPVDYKSLSPEDRQLFGKFVNELLMQNKWISLEAAQRKAYQLVCDKRLEIKSGKSLADNHHENS